MTEVIARGRELARDVLARASVRAGALQRKLGRSATLAIVAGDDADSRRFVELKELALAGCRSRFVRPG
jgi:hypothetical protein